MIAPRKAHTSMLVETTIDNAHTHDVLHNRKGERWLVQEVKRVGLRRRVRVLNLETLATDERTYEQSYLVRIQAEHECECGGTGVWAWGGSMNGKPVHAGEHFRCQGKGWQSRADVVRNSNYDNYGARV